MDAACSGFETIQIAAPMNTNPSRLLWDAERGRIGSGFGDKLPASPQSCSAIYFDSVDPGSLEEMQQLTSPEIIQNIRYFCL